MTYKQLVIFIVLLMTIQTVVIMVITRKNKKTFEKFPHATSYLHAIAQLAKEKPAAAFIIKACYAASLIELFILILFRILGD